jgi:2,4-dienoyl-CoA reductase-like NADH-dependent reductase (Old Yellow Enzyme family)
MPSISTPNRYGTETLSAEDQALLSEPLTLPFSGKVIKNRFCKAALSENLGRKDGQLDKSNLDRLVNVYNAWAEGGSGMILTGNVMVDRTMREMELNVAVEDERDIGRLKVWAQAVQKHGEFKGLILDHARGTPSTPMNICSCADQILDG